MCVVIREPHEAKRKSFGLGGKRTHDLRIRSTVTLPTELQGRTEKVMKMSSTKRHQVCGWYGACVSASVSNLARNRLAYDGAMRVPMVVPCVWTGWM